MDKTSIFFANPDKPGHVMRSIVAFGVVCMLLFAVVGCEASKEASEPDEIEDCEDKIEQCDNAEPLTELKGTKWRLVGIVDTETGVLRELLPKHCTERYTLTFETDRIAFARGIKFTLKVDLDNLNSWVTGDFWCGMYDGSWFCDNDEFRIAVGTARSYSVIGEELRLFVDDRIGDFYSLFKRIDFDEEEWGDNEQIHPLRETDWKLVGIVDTRTGHLRELEIESSWSENCEDCFTLRFINHRSFIARAVGGTFFGSYRFDYAIHHISITMLGSGLGSGSFDAMLFSRALWYAQSFEVTTDGKLKLYSLMSEDDSYPFYLFGEIINNSYLLFKRKQQ